MKKLLTALLVLLLIFVLCACVRDPASSTPDGGQGSTPSASQPDNPGQVNLPSRRPAHNLQSLNEIVGWYEIEYREGTRYPSKVTTTNHEGVVKQIYELVFDEHGVPFKLNVCNNKGELKDTEVELFCDKQGNISDVLIYDKEGSVSQSYALFYNEEGRMITTIQKTKAYTLELNYDERYCITLAVLKRGSSIEKVELGYDQDYRVIKRLVRDRTDVVVSGYEQVYDAAGVLREQYKHKNGVIVEEKKYNEKGLLVVELSRSADEQKVMRITQSYDDQDRVTKISLLENDQTVSWTDITYEDLTSTAVTYDADGKITERRYLENDEKDNLLKKIISDGDGNVLENYVYTYNENGVKIASSEYIYYADGTLLNGEERSYDQEGRLIRRFQYRKNGLVHGNECEWDETGKRLWRKIYQSDGSYTHTEYVPGTQLTRKSTTYNAEGQVIASLDYTYDEDNHLLKSVRCYEDGTKMVRVYNEKFLQAERIWYGVDGKITSRKVYTYNDDKSIALVITYGPENELMDRTEYHYDTEGKKSSVVTYDPDGKVIERTEYTYYDSGYLRSQITYGPDGSITREQYFRDYQMLQG